MAMLSDLLCQVTSLSSLIHMRSSSGSPTDSEDSASRFVGSVPTRSKAHARRCGFPECHKTAKRGGLCISHGGGKKCSVEGCTTSVVSRGVCVAHGGGKRCQAPACTKSAQTGGFCWIHGGGKKCGYLGCKKRAQSGGACISHGGGKRCRMEGCNKVVQYDGLCVGHGGYRKCLSLNCEKRAMANSYCQAHGGNSRCRIAGCQKRAIRDGICSDHKTQMPLHAARTSVRSRLSIELKETPFKVEPTESSRLALDQFKNPVAAKVSLEFRGASTHSRMSQAVAPTEPHILSPLQYVRRGASALLDEGRTMVTPIAKHFNAGQRYDPYHPQRRSLPRLPSFQTLQRSCDSSPWSEGSEVDWSSCAFTSHTVPALLANSPQTVLQTMNRSPCL